MTVTHHSFICHARNWPTVARGNASTTRRDTCQLNSAMAMKGKAQHSKLDQGTSSRKENTVAADTSQTAHLA